MKSCIRMCLIAVLLLSAVAAIAEPVTLAYKFTSGDVDKYRMTMDMSMSMPGMTGESGVSPMNMTMSVTCTQKTLSVNPDGSAKIKMTYGAPVISGSSAVAKNAAKAPKIEGRSVILTMSKRGQMISIEGMDKLMGGQALPGMDFSSLLSSQALLPEGPVDVGQSWTQAVALPFGNSDMEVKSTLDDANVQMWNLQAAKVKQTYKASINLADMFKAIGAGSAAKGAQMPDFSKMAGDLTMDGDMSFVFAPSIGKLLKGDGTIRADMTMNMPPEAVKQGAPSTIKFGMNMTIGLTRFK